MNDVDANATTAANDPSPHRPELVEQVDAEVRELDSLSTHQLSQRYRELFHRDPPIKDARWKKRRIAWQVQAMAFGGLSERTVARLREIQQLMGLDLAREGPTVRSKVSRPTRHDHLASGAVLVRQWRGEEIRVLVRDDGSFEMNGQIFKTLTSVVRSVTGTHWNAKLWFGLVSRSRKS